MSQKMSQKTGVPTIHYFGEKCHRFLDEPSGKAERGEKRFWFGENYGENTEVLVIRY